MTTYCAESKLHDITSDIICVSAGELNSTRYGHEQMSFKCQIGLCNGVDVGVLPEVILMMHEMRYFT